MKSDDWGPVYRGVNSDGKSVLIRTLRAELASDQDQVVRFYGRAKAGFAIGGHRLPESYEIAPHEDGHVWVSEMIAGRTLLRELGRGEAFSEQKALKIICRVAQGVRTMHDNGFLHLDLRLNHIRLGEENRARICDYGVAWHLESGRRFCRPKKSLCYASSAPEHLYAPSRIGPVADVYSLGMLLYAMLTGRLPFRGPRKVTGQLDYKPARAINAEISVPTDRLINACLRFKPETRPQSANQFGIAAKSALQLLNNN